MFRADMLPEGRKLGQYILLDSKSWILGGIRVRGRCRFENELPRLLARELGATEPVRFHFVHTTQSLPLCARPLEARLQGARKS